MKEEMLRGGDTRIVQSVLHRIHLEVYSLPMASSTPPMSGSSSPSTSTPPLCASSGIRIDEVELEQKLFSVYTEEVKKCDENGQSTQHIGDEWMRREIRKICGFDVSDRWIKLFRRKFNIRYFSGRRHTDKPNKLTPLAALDTTKVKTSNFLKERRVLRTSRKEYSDVDSRVNEEIVRRQAKGERLTNPWIREYAQFIASQLYPQTTEVQQFFDANWLYRFKRRYCVELKPRGADEVVSRPTVGNDESPPMMMTMHPNYQQMLQFHRYFNFVSQNGSEDVRGGEEGAEPTRTTN